MSSLKSVGSVVVAVFVFATVAPAKTPYIADHRVDISGSMITSYVTVNDVEDGCIVTWVLIEPSGSSWYPRKYSIPSASSAGLSYWPSYDVSCSFPLSPSRGPGTWCVHVFVAGQSVRDCFALFGSTPPLESSANEAPRASFKWETLAGSSYGEKVAVEPRPGRRIRFDASESSDSDGEVVEYAWDWDSDGSFDETRTEPIIEHEFGTSGSHRVTLCVTDDVGATDGVTKTIAVNERRPPEAALSFSPFRPSILDAVQFTDVSSDADGEIESWSWTFGDSATSTERHPTHRYEAKGEFTVTLTVTDDDGMTDTTTQQLTVVNLDPDAAFTFVPEEAMAGQAVEFDAAVSGDQDGEIVSYTWDFDADGGTDAEGVTATWSFRHEGEYTVQLAVTDNNGATDSTEKQITVAIPSGPLEFDEVWAAVIGVGDYQDPVVDDLIYTEPDAGAFYNFLTNIQAGGFPKDHVRLRLGSEVTLTELRDAFSWLADTAAENDLVVFYFSGHGSHAADRNNDEDDGLDEYLVPWDAEKARIQATALCDDEVGYWLSNLRCRNVLLVFDSCFSGGALKGARSFSESGTKAAVDNRVFTDLLGEGRLFLAASQESEAAMEDPLLQHGVFTYFLLKGLGGLKGTDSADADSSGDGRVTVRELKEYLVREMSRYSQQTPQVIGDERLLEAPITGYQQPPVARFSWEPDVPTAGWEVRFVDASSDDGQIVAYEWDFGDGTHSSEQAPTHAYTEDGIYMVTLSVTDDVGLQATQEVDLSIGPPGDVAVIAGERIIISLGSANGVNIGDRFEVIRIHQLSDGTMVTEPQAVIEVVELIGEDRSACVVISFLRTIESGYQVRLIN